MSSCESCKLWPNQQCHSTEGQW